MIKNICFPILILLAPGTVIGESRCDISDPLKDYFKSDGVDPVGDGAVFRLQGDFTNDGLDDVALTQESLCGMKVCSWTLYRRCSRTSYRKEDFFKGPSLWYSFRVVPVKPGTARIEECLGENENPRKASKSIRESCSYPEYGDFPCDTVRNKNGIFEIKRGCSREG